MVTGPAMSSTSLLALFIDEATAPARSGQLLRGMMSDLDAASQRAGLAVGHGQLLEGGEGA
eukprot:15449264-Alexandrium_andersonii.AAC.1